MTTEHVYLIRNWAIGVDRPRIDFGLAENEGIDWLTIEKIVLGDGDRDGYSPIRLTTCDADADKWHFYRIPGLFGILSEAAAGLLGKYMAGYFELLDASLNDLPFYLPRVIRRLDCLDRALSVVNHYPDSRSIESVTYRFHKSTIPDPAVFPIQESRTKLFGTDTAKRAVESAGLSGFFFVDAEELQGE